VHFEIVPKATKNRHRNIGFQKIGSTYFGCGGCGV